MKIWPNAVITAIIGGVLSAMATISPIAASADELSDLRANNDLLQRRLDQLAQVGTAKPTVAPGTATLAGSFPRSFLIPGTDTSLLIGGFVQLTMLYEMSGGNPNGNEGTPNNGAGGFVQSVPLDLHGQKFGTATLSPPVIGNQHSRGSGIFQMAARNSRLHIETRTPTAWGLASTIWEVDFYGCSSGGVDCDNLNHGTNPHLMRLRLAYGTLGGFIAGQNTVPVNDNGSAAELIDFGGSFGKLGYARAPQVGYKMPLPWAGGGASFGAYLVDPDTEVSGPTGAYETDSTLGLAGTFTPSPTVSTTPGAGNLAVNPAKSTLPDLNLVLEWQQPWGHLRLSGVLQKLELQDGAFITQDYVGYGGGVSGHVKPAWLGWTKDNFGFTAWAGSGLGRYAAGSGGGSATFTNALATNFGGVGATCLAGKAAAFGAGCYGNDPAATTAANAALVRARTINEFGGNINYQHWWTPNLRSSIDWGMHHQDIPISLVGANSTTAGYNKELMAAHANLMWSPVPFVTTGIEYTWGHRVTLANTKGDDNTIAAMFQVKF